MIAAISRKSLPRKLLCIVLKIKLHKRGVNSASFLYSENLSWVFRVISVQGATISSFQAQTPVPRTFLSSHTTEQWQALPASFPDQEPKSPVVPCSRTVSPPTASLLSAQCFTVSPSPWDPWKYVKYGQSIWT